MKGKNNGKYILTEAYHGSKRNCEDRLEYARQVCTPKQYDWISANTHITKHEHMVIECGGQFKAITVVERGFDSIEIAIEAANKLNKE